MTILKIENRCSKIVNFANSKDVTRLKNNIHVITRRYCYLYLSNLFKLINNLVPIIDQSLMSQKLKSETRLNKKRAQGYQRTAIDFQLLIW